MIKVQIVSKADKITKITVKGHANSAEYGKDLVCAGVSAVVVGGMNAIQNDESFKFVMEEGLVIIEAIGEVSTHDDVVLETIVTGLKTIQESNKQFIKISEN